MTNTPIISIRQLGLALNKEAPMILQGISYEIHANDFIILLGSNGSGKSSLLKLIDRRYRPTQGYLTLDCKNIQNYSQACLSKYVTTLTQNHSESLFPALTILENAMLAKQRHEKKLWKWGISRKERNFFAEYLAEFNPTLPLKLNMPASALSGGEQQALALALSILYPPRVLLLDEHTSALDPIAAKRLMQITATAIQKHRIPCVLCTHDLTLALSYGNRILALQQGKIRTCIESVEKSTLTLEALKTACY